MRIITTTPKWLGHEAADLSAEFYDEFKRLSMLGVKVYVLTDTVGKEYLEREGMIEVVKVRVIRKPKLYALSKFLSYAVTLFSLAARGSVDLIYIRQFSPIDLTLCILARFMRRPPVLVLGGTWLFAGPRSLKVSLFRLILRLSVKASSRVVLYSPLMLSDVERFTGRIRADKLVYIRNGVDIKRFSPNLRADFNVLSRWNVGPDDKVVLYVGRVNRKKGVEEVVRAISIIAEKDIKVKALLTGLVEESYGEELKKLIDSLGLRDKVIVTGPVPHHQLPQVYINSKVFVFMSRGGEGIPRAILEAMACGKAVISTPVAGVPDVIKNNENGLLVPVGDYGALAEAILRLISDEELTKTLGMRAREFVVANHSWDVVAPKLVAIFKKLVPRP